jgi:hypothetical protein
MRKGGMHRMSLKDEWDRLDEETRKSILDNPGGVILSRTMSEKISAEAEGEFERDQHGQISLSREDLDFIREKAAGAGQDPPPAQTEHRFFDTNQP